MSVRIAADTIRIGPKLQIATLTGTSGRDGDGDCDNSSPVFATTATTTRHSPHHISRQTYQAAISEVPTVNEVKRLARLLTVTRTREHENTRTRERTNPARNEPLFPPPDLALCSLPGHGRGHGHKSRVSQTPPASDRPGLAGRGGFRLFKDGAPDAGKLSEAQGREGIATVAAVSGSVGDVHGYPVQAVPIRQVDGRDQERPEPGMLESPLSSRLLRAHTCIPRALAIALPPLHSR